MSFRLDKILREFIEYDLGVTRLGRSPGQATPRLFLAKTLAMLEACGDAMRTLDVKGNICWKATPALRDRIDDLRADGEGDLAGEEV
jgi:hypothetical protein